MRFDDLIGLARLSFLDPAQAVRRLRALDLPMSARWMVLALAVLLSTLLMVMIVNARPDGVLPLILDVARQPLLYVAMLYTALAIGAWVLTTLGRAMGGRAEFADILLIVAWIEMLLFSMQLVQSVILLVSPLLSALIGLVAMLLVAVASVRLIGVLHGFDNLLIVVVLIFISFIATVFLLSIVVTVLGIAPQLPQVPS
ncbi:MAG: Yip1 family protein [Paracoccus sp. (in: a-proteobacteria)]|nr:Yip1 family protein [Paracoccus sp. (in: a-proteobacteria)]